MKQQISSAEKTGYRLFDCVTISYFLVVLASVALSLQSSPLPYAAFFIWLLFAKKNNATIFRHIFKLDVHRWIVYYCLILLIVATVGNNILSGFKFCISAFCMFAPMYIYNYYTSIYSGAHFKVTKIVTVALLFMTGYCTKWQYEHPGSARAVTSGEIDTDEVVFGGVMFAAASAVFAVYLLYLLKTGVLHTYKTKLFYMLLFAISFLLVLTSGSTISSLNVVLFCCFVFLPSKVQKGMVWFILIVSIFVLMFSSTVGQIIIAMSQLFDDPTTADRLNSLGAILAYGKNNSDSLYFLDRFFLPMISVETFFHNPIIGVAYKYGNDWTLGHLYGVGSHSEWADPLAKFGLFGIVYYKIFIRQLKRCYKDNSTKLWIYAWLSLGLFNPIVTEFSNVLCFYLIPSMYNYYKCQE